MNFNILFENNLKLVFPEFFLLTTLLILLVYSVMVNNYSTILLSHFNFSSFKSIDKKLPVFNTLQTNIKPIIIKNLTWLVIYSFFLCFLLILNNPINLTNNSITIFNECLIQDDFSNIFKSIILLSAIITLFISFDYNKIEKINTFEYSILIGLATSGMLFLVSAYDLISFYLALEMQSLCLYILASLKRYSAYSTEAGLKYFILGAFSSCLLLFGCSIIYGLTGTISFEELAIIISSGNDSALFSIMLMIGIIFIMIALLFKIAAVPFHQWSPDIIEGAPTNISTFFAITPKIAIFGLFIRLFFFSFFDLISYWQQILIFCSFSSMIIASLSAFNQRKLKRFLAFSTVGHVGYILIGFSAGTFEGLESMLIYIIIYILTTINVWSFVLAIIPVKNNTEKKFNRLKYFTELRGLSKKNPLLTITFTIALFSMAGIPPLAGFCAKLFIFFSAINAKLYLLVFTGIFTSVIGCFYYIRFVKIMYFEKLNNISFSTLISIDREKSIILAITFIFLIGFFIYPTILLNLAHKIAITILI
jgi:proton-translocating NADH-quinone oxidoreductase chain N